MAVRGLGCPVRFALTAGQKGDAPQADALIEDLPAQVVMADAAYDSDRLRKAIADKGAVAVIPNNPSRARNILSTSTSTPSVTSSNAAFQSLSIFAGSQRASRRPPATIALSSLSPPSSYGFGKCPQDLADAKPAAINTTRFKRQLSYQFRARGSRLGWISLRFQSILEKIFENLAKLAGQVFAS
jgi:transposase